MESIEQELKLETSPLQRVTTGKWMTPISQSERVLHWRYVITMIGSILTENLPAHED